MKNINVGSDFSGVGAFDQALIRLNIDYETVFACDKDKHARQTYTLNYGQPSYYPNDVYLREIPKDPLDIYMTSPPCQAFSMVGKRLGEADKKGILFYNSHEFIIKNKPRYFIFENVKGLLSDNNGKTFGKWIDLLGGKSVNGNHVIFPNEQSTPYHLYWKVINAKDQGVPQNRERVFVVGIRDDCDNNFSFNKDLFLHKKLRDILEISVIKKYHLTNKQLKSFNDKGGDFGNRFNIVDIDSYAMALTTKSGNGVITNNYLQCEEAESGVRFLTPREYFRLMDFPETFVWNCSDAQAYKQAGNSIVVKCLENIINKLKL